MFRNMVTSLFLHERIYTTLFKAKELRRVAEKLVTLGKRGDLAARRFAARTLKPTGKVEGKKVINDQEALKKLFSDLATRYAGRPGGYTRIVRAGQRLGDCAPMAYIEMIPAEKKATAAKAKGGKKSKDSAKTEAAAPEAAKE
jgi:large subunit ribosomal protein L17